MKPRVLLIGKNGQVGHDLEKLLPRLGESVALDRSDLDLTSPRAIRDKIESIRPHLIINAAAYTAVDQAEIEESAAQKINAEAPAVIAQTARKVGAGLVHYSTDYVFDGTQSSPYEEHQPTNPINAYGRSKLAGEEAIRKTGVPHLIFRTAWVYSTRGKNFLLTILRLATQREELCIVQDQIGAPTSSQAIAQATVEVVAQMLNPQTKLDARAWEAASGTYNITAAGNTNWAEFAGEILAEASNAIQNGREPTWLRDLWKGKRIVAKRVIPIASAAYPTLAKRPSYSVLSNARLESQFGVRLPNWREQLQTIFNTGT
jgi:dTDP-4-dehydrorhamnose reductase